MTGFNISTYYYTDKRISISLYLFFTLIILIQSIYSYISYVDSDKDLLQSLKDVERVRHEIFLLKKESLGNKQYTDHARISKDIKETEEIVSYINNIIEQKNFSWSELLFSLEKAAPKDISITSIKPSYNSKRISITGLAKNLKTVTQLVDNLNNTKYIKKSFLTNEQKVLIDNKYNAISFEIVSEGNF